MLKIKFVVLLISFALLAQTGMAQKVSKREWTIFQKGVQDYQTGAFKKAGENFSLVISKLPDSRLLTANYLMLAKTQYKTGDYNNSLHQCEIFTSKFPQSTYIDDIYYLMGNNYYRLNRFETAVSTWLFVASKRDNPKLAEKTLQLAEDAIRYRLDEQSLLHLKEDLDNEFSKHVFLYHLAERYHKAGNSASALVMLDEMLKEKSSTNLYTVKAEKLYNLLKDKKSNAIRIAALLPLSGTNSDIGTALLDGAKLAVEDFNRLHDIDVEIVPYDYEGRLITAVKKLKDIACDHSISAVFGPVENDITTACAAISQYENITLITPTATENALNRLSSNLVQLATPLNVTAEKLAKFSYDSLRIKRIVTLAPIEDYFIRLTNTFVEKHKEKNGHVIAEQWYYPGDKDFSKQFKVLKRIGLRLTFGDSLSHIDSTLTENTIDSLYREYLRNERLRLEETKTKIDSADIPVTAFDGIFMPIYKDDINLIAPQFAYSNLQAQILGNGDWYDKEALNKNKNYLNGLIFITDGYLNEESWDYKQFRNNFRTTFKRTPEKYELIGYDSFNFILSVFSGGDQIINRTNFTRALKRLPYYNGIYRNFEIGEKRSNSSVRILKYLYGQIVPLN